MKVLVIGGTGMLGAPVVRRLAADGYEVAVVSRSEGKATAMFGGTVKALQTDIHNAEALAATLPGFDAVHLSLPAGPRFEDCFHNETRVAELVAQAASKSGVKRLSYLSGTGAAGTGEFPPSKAKILAEQAIRQSGVPFTIWRPTWFMEALRHLARFGMIGIPGSGKVSAHWIAGRDYAAMVSQALKTDAAAGRTFYVFGQERVSLMDAARIYRDAVHPNRLIVKAPLGVLIAMGSVIPDRNMWFGAQLLKHLEQEGELGDPGECFEMFGKPKISLKEFGEEEKKRKRSAD